MGNPWARRIYRVHAWLGLAAGVFLLYMSLTGTLLVFAPELDRALNPALLRVEPGGTRVPFDTMLSRVSAAHPGATPYAFRMIPEAPDEAYTVSMRDAAGEFRFVHVDPYTGRVTGSRHGNDHFVRILLWLHYSLRWKPWGQVFVFGFGLALLGSVATGSYVYRKSLLRVFRLGIRRRHLAGDLHHLVGVASLAFNLMIAGTGAWMLWPAVRDAFAPPPAAPDEAPAPVLRASLDTAVEEAARLWPEFRLTQIYLPLAQGDPLELAGWAPGNPLLERWGSAVRFSPETGALREIYDVRKQTWTTQLGHMVVPAHFGDWGGLPVKLLYSLLGLSPGLLSVTGAVMWFRKRRRSMGAPRRAATPAKVQPKPPALV